MMNKPTETRAQALERIQKSHDKGLMRPVDLQAKHWHRRCAELLTIVAEQQATIDALMFEYCPDDMTSDQITEWAKHQRSVIV